MSRPRILVVDDEPGIRAAVGEILSDEGYEVALADSAAAARREAALSRPDLVLLDIWMEGEDGISLLREWVNTPSGAPPVVMMSGHGTVDTAVEATRLGALDFIEKPVSLAKLLYVVERALKTAPHHRVPLGSGPLLDVVDAHPAMARLKRALEAAAASEEPVLFIGEPGTGRETLARRLGRQCQRAFMPFVVADSDASSMRSTLASALRAQDRVLLFLNELSDVPPDVQGVLAAFLAEKTDDRVRLAASMRPEVAGAAEPVRRDVYDKLAVLVIEVPPLRVYRDFIPEVVRYYVDNLADREGYAFRQFSISALNRMRRHEWPGNLQELENLIKRLLASGSTGPVRVEEVDAAFSASAPAIPRLGEDLLSLPYREARERFERGYLSAQLELAEGRVAKLAERVQLERTHLYRKLKALGIELPSEERGGE